MLERLTLADRTLKMMQTPPAVLNRHLGEGTGARGKTFFHVLECHTDCKPSILCGFGEKKWTRGKWICQTVAKSCNCTQNSDKIDNVLRIYLSSFYYSIEGEMGGQYS